MDGLKLFPGIRTDYHTDTKTWTADPRLGARFDVHAGYPRTTLKGGVGLYHQPPQPYQSIAPFGTPGVGSPSAVHTSLGIEQEISHPIELSIEGFHKDLKNLVVAVPDATGSQNGISYQNIGSGRSYGAEFLLRYKPQGKFFGWVAYTLSRSERRDHPGDALYLYEYDQTHILTALGSYKLGRGWQAGARFRYISGSRTRPSSAASSTTTQAPMRHHLDQDQLRAHRRLPPARSPHRQDLAAQRLVLQHVSRRSKYLLSQQPGRGCLQLQLFEDGERDRHPLPADHRPARRTMNQRSIFGLLVSALGSLGSLGLLATTSCAPDFDPVSRVVTLRVLAQQTDLPFAKPGETVNISSLSYDPQGRTLNWAWAACVNPAESTVQGCLDKIADDATATGTPIILAQGPDMSHFSYTVPSDALSSLPEKARPAAQIGVLSVACPGDLSLQTDSNNLPFTCREPGTGRALALDEFIFGMKRIQVRQTDRNQNPIIEQVTFDGADWPEGEVKQVTACDTDNNDYKPCSDASKHKISARPSAASTESGTTEFGVAFSEQVIIEYYATDGVFEYEIKIASSPETGWAARKAASGKDLTLWMVVHDDRGGATWAQRQVHVQ